MASRERMLPQWLVELDIQRKSNMHSANGRHEPNKSRNKMKPKSVSNDTSDKKSVATHNNSSYSSLKGKDGPSIPTSNRGCINGKVDEKKNKQVLLSDHYTKPINCQQAPPVNLIVSSGSSSEDEVDLKSDLRGSSSKTMGDNKSNTQVPLKSSFKVEDDSGDETESDLDIILPISSQNGILSHTVHNKEGTQVAESSSVRPGIDSGDEMESDFNVKLPIPSENESIKSNQSDITSYSQHNKGGMQVSGSSCVRPMNDSGDETESDLDIQFPISSQNESMKVACSDKKWNVPYKKGVTQVTSSSCTKLEIDRSDETDSDLDMTVSSQNGSTHNNTSCSKRDMQVTSTSFTILETDSGDETKNNQVTNSSQNECNDVYNKVDMQVCSSSCANNGDETGSDDDVRLQIPTQSEPARSPNMHDAISSSAADASAEEDCDSTNINNCVGANACYNVDEGCTNTNGGDSVTQTSSSNNIAANSTSVPRPKCKYGSQCYRKNPQHRQDFSHPEDPDYVMVDNRPECQYGLSCYRKNPLHQQHYKHTKRVQKLRQAKHDKKQNNEDEEEDDDDYDLDDPFINDGSSDDYNPSDSDSETDFDPKEDEVSDSESPKKSKRLRRH